MFTTRPDLIGDLGMVASTHWLASATGMAVLERGGNAADAAVAAGFVLQVVEPHLNGPGGDAPILVWSERDQLVRTICGQGVAPQRATIDAMRGLGLDIVPGTGFLPAVVPGSFGAWLLLLQEHGTMRFRDVLEPAIGYAERGHPLLATASRTIGTVEALFRDEWTSSAAQWLPDGRVPRAGERVRNQALAATWRRLVEEAEAAGADRDAQIDAARDAWYRGFVVEAIDRFVREPVMDVSGRRHAGFLTADDLAAWSATTEATASLDYRGTTLHKAGPWTQGPTVLQQLALLDGFDLDAVAPGSADWVHLVVETSKLAMADREAWYGDPAFTDVPLDDLLGRAYADERRALIGDDASLELRPGAPGGRMPRLPHYPDAAPEGPSDGGLGGTGEPTVRSSGLTRGDTCHVDVVDRDGMMISATPSGGWLQSSPVIPDLGFPLGTRGQMFWLEEGLPNSLRPGARPRTTLSPSFATRDGKPWIAFGTPGGDAQDQWQLQFFLNVVHGRMSLQQAIDAPAFQSTHAPSSFWPRDAHPGELLIEDRFDPEVLRELERRGHRLVVGGGWSEGRLSAVAREDGWLKGAANPRGAQGYAVGR